MGRFALDFGRMDRVMELWRVWLWVVVLLEKEWWVFGFG